MLMLLKNEHASGWPMSKEILIKSGCLNDAYNISQYLLAFFSFSALLAATLLLHFSYFGNLSYFLFWSIEDIYFLSFCLLFKDESKSERFMLIFVLTFACICVILAISFCITPAIYELYAPLIIMSLFLFGILFIWIMVMQYVIRLHLG
jgi:hypothetical protein